MATTDRETIEELSELLQKARDKAHWLSVHRRMSLADHIEGVTQTALRMSYDLRAQEARGEA